MPNKNINSGKTLTLFWRWHCFGWSSSFLRKEKSLRGSRNSPLVLSSGIIRELKQPRRRRQQERHEFAYVTTENCFARLARAFSRFLTFRRGSRSFRDVKWPVLQFCGRRGPMMTNVEFCILTFEALVPSQLQDSGTLSWLWMIKKWLEKRKVMFSDDVLAAFDVVFAEAP